MASGEERLGVGSRSGVAPDPFALGAMALEPGEAINRGALTAWQSVAGGGKADVEVGKRVTRRFGQG